MSCSCHLDRQPNAIAPNRTLFKHLYCTYSVGAHTTEAHTRPSHFVSLSFICTLLSIHSSIHSILTLVHRVQREFHLHSADIHMRYIYIQSISCTLMNALNCLSISSICCCCLFFVSYFCFEHVVSDPMKERVNAVCFAREWKKVERFLSIRFKIDVSLPTLKLSYF